MSLGIGSFESNAVIGNAIDVLVGVASLECPNKDSIPIAGGVKSLCGIVCPTD